MEDSPDTGIPLYFQILLLLALILINGYFTMAETALVNSNKTKLKILADEGKKNAKKILDFTEKPNRLIATTQMIIMFIVLLSGGFMIVEMSSPLQMFLDRKAIIRPGFFSVLILTVILTFFVLWLGNWFPKKIAMQHAESIAMRTVSFIAFMTAVLKPFVWFNYKCVNLLLKVCRQKVTPEEDNFSEEEIMSMLETGQERGALKEEGMKMIDSIFAFDDKLAYEIMTPRTDVFAIDINDSPDEYMNSLMSLKFSRIPVYDDDIDNIKGVLHIKDFLIQAWKDGFNNVCIEKILRKPYFVPDTKNIDSLFFELQKSKQHIAILIDEYGGFAGIVTMEDIIEEVMGDIDDEYDDDEIEIIRMAENEYLINGNMNIDDVNEVTGAGIESGNSETIGGFVMELLGEIPDERDRETLVPEYKNLIFEVISVKDRRIEKIKLHVNPSEYENNEDKENSDGEKDDTL